MDDVELEEINHSIRLEEESQLSCSKSLDNVYIPQVSEKYKPKVGQEFDSLDEVHDFYVKYAKESGFSVRINSSRKCKDTNEVLRKEYVCSKEGESRKEVVETKRRRGQLREGCKAKLAVVMSKLGKYVISVFIEEHSHPLATSRIIHLLRSHRCVSEAKRSLTHHLGATNVPTHQQFSILEFQSEDVENIGCTKKDIYNYETRLHNEMKGRDAEMLKEYFLTEQEKDPSFIFQIEVDDDSKLRCFWADSISRRAYRYFGDVIVFDTTYNTNHYGMIFAPLLGVNNHGQTIIFGSAFLSDEKAESFVWLFEQFNKIMCSNTPKMIITDQDATMTKAIAQTLPETFHRYCSWHIMEKFSTYLDAVTYRDFYKDFQSCIWESECPEEFERKWVTVIENANLYDNTWLQSVFNIRSRWVPAYVNHIFSAGMSSSQRAESSHAFFKKYVSKKNLLMDFILRFNRALAHQRHEELNADHIDINDKPLIKLPLAMEKQMAEMYTRKIFYKFQSELWHSLVDKVDFLRENDTHNIYKVEGETDGGVSRLREIVYDKTLDFASCSCKKFESEGITCRHILAYLRMNGNIRLPSQYILKRWTKLVKFAVNFEKLTTTSHNSMLTWRTKLFQLASDAIDKAIKNEETCVMLQDSLDEFIDKIKPLVGESKSGGVSEKGSNIQETSLNAPDQIRAKECRRMLKGGKDKAIKAAKYKGRRCNGCGKIGVSHDKRNCPVLNTQSSYFQDNPEQPSDSEAEAEEDSISSAGLL